MHTVRMHKPASPLDDIRGGLEGPPLSSLVLLHDLAAWLCQALQLGDLKRAEREVRKRLLAHEACTVYGFPPGHDPQPLPVVAVVPVEGGRRVLSRGPWGGLPRPAAPATATVSARGQALLHAELQHVAVSRAVAAELFGYPLQVEAAPAPAAEPAPPAPPEEWTPERLRARRDELKAQGIGKYMQRLATESGVPTRTIQHQLKQLADAEEEARRTRLAMGSMASHVVKGGKRRT